MQLELAAGWQAGECLLPQAKCPALTWATTQCNVPLAHCFTCFRHKRHTPACSAHAHLPFWDRCYARECLFQALTRWWCSTPSVHQPVVHVAVLPLSMLTACMVYAGRSVREHARFRLGRPLELPRQVAAAMCLLPNEASHSYCWRVTRPIPELQFTAR